MRTVAPPVQNEGCLGLPRSSGGGSLPLGTGAAASALVHGLSVQHARVRGKIQGRVCAGMHEKGGGGGGGASQRRSQERLGRRLEGVAEAVGGGYCRLQMQLNPAVGVRGAVAGHRQNALERGGGIPPLPMHPCVCGLCRTGRGGEGGCKRRHSDWHDLAQHKCAYLCRPGSPWEIPATHQRPTRRSNRPSRSALVVPPSGNLVPDGPVVVYELGPNFDSKFRT